MYFLFLVVALFFSSDQLSNLTYIIISYYTSIYFIYPIDYCYIFYYYFGRLFFMFTDYFSFTSYGKW
jgi:hypothetical protein|uniref:Uncharacterized protein n=1 Tax=Populus trichocarpa TaxID=3694 RepID=A0A2K1YG14_POPTR